ncbi:PREDICTED: leukemia NUP98 fusion partner 1 [Pseudopodoces humilis]|uniref:leukemia NUP98 fusion partner 1 n=1 Tax=Pseudopodoces humilis TaxID=181119 RepID=UPI000395B9BE|nr:PREDICTED: leukemia NUP98 fusion partner 1 [Pseudopodoces humilis]
MEYDEDDDIFFAKWMSSFWGHSLTDEEKEGRGHKKHQPRLCSERRASLPAKLSSLHATRLHASAKGSSSGHLRDSKEFQEDQDVKCHFHSKASRTPSADSSCPETRSNSIQEFAESFEKQLHLKSKRSVSLQPEGAKERQEREKLHLRKSKSHKKMGEKSEARRDREEAESSEVPAKHSQHFPSQASIQKGYVCTGS